MNGRREPVDNPAGTCPATHGGVHAFAWTGRVPCTGAWACMYCGGFEADTFDGRPDDPHGWNAQLERAEHE